jgi:hypothetical protein
LHKRYVALPVELQELMSVGHRQLPVMHELEMNNMIHALKTGFNMAEKFCIFC